MRPQIDFYCRKFRPSLKEDYKFLRCIRHDFNFPTGLAIHLETGTLYVADTYHHLITIFNPDGSLLTEFTPQTPSFDGDVTPSGLAFDFEDNLVVTDSRNHQVLVYDRHTGHLKRGWGEWGNEENYFDTPSAVAIDLYGNYLISDTGQTPIGPIGDFYFSMLFNNSLTFSQGNHRIQVLTPSGKWLKTIGSKGPRAGQLLLPGGIGVNGEGNIYVSDHGNHRIQVFSPSGQSIRLFGKRGNELGQFVHPCGITVDRRGKLVVCDQDNHRLQLFDEEGQFLKSFGGMGLEEGNFLHPVGISLDREGNISVVESSSKRLQTFG